MMVENVIDRSEAQRRDAEASGLMLGETLLRGCLGYRRDDRRYRAGRKSVDAAEA